MEKFNKKDWSLLIAIIMLMVIILSSANANPPKHRKLKKVYYSTCAAYRDNMMFRHTGRHYKKSFRNQ